MQKKGLSISCLSPKRSVFQHNTSTEPAGAATLTRAFCDGVRTLDKAPLLQARKGGKNLCMEMTCAILAGGRSLRMGRDKATIPIGNRPLVSRVYDVARTIFDRILIVSNLHAAIEGVEAPIVPDVLPQRGPMVGIVSALLHATTPYVFVLGCDMPFVREETIRFVAGQATGHDIVIPKTEKGYEPLHAVYNRATISPLLTRIERGQFSIVEVFPFVTVHVVEGPDLSEAEGFSIFTNLNTEEDLARARTRL